MPTPGQIAVSVSITNEREIMEPSIQDLAVYDTRMTVTVNPPGQIVPKRLGFADDDVRYAEAATVVGRGRGCVAQHVSKNSIVAETLPLHIQQHVTATDHNVDITYSNLAGEYMPTLESIASAMGLFLRSWDFSSATTSEELRSSPTCGAGLRQSRTLRTRVRSITQRCTPRPIIQARQPHVLRSERFHGRLALVPTRLRRLELGALAGRENPSDPRLRAELDAVDVLWFPTGGGRPRRISGLITVGLFFDRLRDKLRGTTAWLLFPLRMLFGATVGTCH